MPSMTDFPDDPKKIRARIRSYERKLRKELEDGWPDDGAGKRLLLGPLYVILGDIPGALASFRWYEQAYPDDGGEAGQFLCWALAHLRAGEHEQAEQRLKSAMFENYLMLPMLLGLPDPAPDLYDKNGWEDHQEVTGIPQKYYDLWSPEEKAWALAKYQGEAFQSALKRFLEIERLLKTTGAGSRRTELCNEKWTLMYGPEKAAELLASTGKIYNS